MASLLRLRLSVAICELLIVLTFGNVSSGCRELSAGQYLCFRITVEEATDFVSPNATVIKFVTTNETRLSLPFRRYFPALNSLEFVDGQLETIEPNSLRQLNDLKILAFPNNELSRLEPSSFSGLVKLETLDLSKNKFASLDDVLPALFSVGNLTFLDLSYNWFESLSYEEPEKLADLTVAKLKIVGCRIINVDPSVLRYWNIDDLSISNNPMDEKGLRNLSLGLRNSNVRILEMKELPSLAFIFSEVPLLPLYDSKIQKLIVGDNDFLFLVTFRSFVSLNDLEFAGADVRGIDMDEWLNLPNLEHLKLRRNTIERFFYGKKFAKSGSMLKTLELDGNRFPYQDISAVFSDMFASLSSLSELLLDQTPLGKTITARTFPGLRKLLKLRLNRGSVEEIEDGAFASLESLKFLSLEGNKLHFLRSEMFIGLRNLTFLDLSSNVLTLGAEPSPFSLLAGLEVLVLKENGISRVGSSLFSNLTKLEVINLNRNTIMPWETKVIPEGGNVSFVLLGSNKIRAVTPSMLEDFSSLQEIDLSDNDFDCWNCSMLMFQKWIASTNVTLSNFENFPGRYACQYPESLKGEPIVTAVLDREQCDEERNKIRAILLNVMYSCLFALAVALGIISYKLRWHLRYGCYLLRSRVKRFKEVQDSFSYQYDAFVSYDSSDSKWVRDRLLATLETGSHRIRFCLLDRDCVAGNDVTEELFDVVQKCRKTLLVLSESYLKNHWCVFEMQIAQHSLFEEKRDSLILIQLQPIDKEVVSANLLYLINTRTYIVWTEHPVGQKIFWKRLLAALARPDTLCMSHIV